MSGFVIHATAIPYKSEPTLAAGQSFSALLLACLLLAALYLLLRYAQRRGWLERWRVAAAARDPAKPARWSIESQRISRRTTVHTLQRGGRTLVVVEHGTGVGLSHWRDDDAVQPSAPEGGPAEHGSQAHE